MKSRDQKSQSESDLKQFDAVARLYESEPLDTVEKLEAFPKYASRQSIAKFLTKYEIFRRILHVNGSVVECGVLHGGGLLAWAKLSSILEPTNHVRKIIGFDTFAGFSSVSERDSRTGAYQDMSAGALKGSPYESVLAAVGVYDLNRPINHIPKVELVRGDAVETIPKYVENNPHLVVALLNLDFDLYEPTKKALEVFVPRMPRGAVIVFDQLNAKIFPGETMAVADAVGIRNLRIERFMFDSYVSFAVLD